jgi:ribosomal protein S18 acetylase RimI-like enzyme
MAALVEPHWGDVVELPKLGGTDLDELLAEEIEVWRERFAWDFRPSADLLRRYMQIHSLYGFALVRDSKITGYSYQVCEGRKGLIGDFFIRRQFAGPASELRLLQATVFALTGNPGIRRIESQLMMLAAGPEVRLPVNEHLKRYDRFFMDIRSFHARRLHVLNTEVRAAYVPWAEKYQEEIAHLVTAAYRGHVDSEINDQYRTIPGARQFLTNIIRFPGCGNFFPSASVVALDDHTGRVCGACLASLVSAASGHITQLCVLPGVRKARLGYELLRRSLLHLCDAGCESISLTVTGSNVAATRLYESVGFRTKAVFPALVWEGF